MGGYSGGGALGGLAQGILAGRELRMHMQRAMDEHQQLQQEIQQRQQEQGARDIQTRMLLGQIARPVSDAGTIEEPAIRTPSFQVGGVELGNADVDGTSIHRMPDRSRTRTYGGQQYELMTPEEQNQRQGARARTMQEATGVRMDAGPGNIWGQLGAQGPVYIPPEHLAQLASPYLHYGQQVPISTLTGGQGSPAGAPATPPAGTSQGIADQMLAEPPEASAAPAAEPTIPMAAVPAFTRLRANQNTNATRVKVADENNAARGALADKNNQTKTAIATGVQAGAAARNATNNSTRLTVAAGNQAGAKARNAATNDTRRAPAAAAQTGKLNRIDAARMDALMKSERAYQDRRATLAPGKDANDLAKSQYNSTTANLQAVQFSKANVRKAAKPSQAALSKIPEGGEGTMPDGHVWQKKDGVVYIVK